MLERASPSIECTAQLLLKTIEGPIKSQRNLGPTFWKHAGDQLDVPAWWPVYLHSIRKNADTYTALPRSQTVLIQQPANVVSMQRCRSPYISTANIQEDPQSHRNARMYTGSSLHWQQSVAPGQEKDDGSFYDVYRQTEPTNEHQRVKIKPQTPGSISQIGMNQPKTQFETTTNNYGNVWKLFVQSGHKKEVAANMLHYLARSTKRTDLRHALTVFDFIPSEQRSESDYETAVNVAIGCTNYKTAVDLAVVALQKGFGKDTYFKLMAHLVDHGLWNTVAILWRQTSLNHRESFRASQKIRKGKSPNMAGRYAFHFEAVTDLPGKVISLASRLSQNDAVLAARRSHLIDLCKRLAYITVESPKAMLNISGEGVLTLLQVQKQFEFNSKLHLAAIGTIRRMRDRGSKSQLAMLIYRNFCFAYPDIKVPLWVYGALISICADARESPQVYRFLLDDIAKYHGRVDAWSLQQVMAACARQGQVDAVFNTFTEFLQVSKPKDLRDVNHLLHVFAVTGDVESTQTQFDRLRSEFKFEPDVVSWTLLLLAHARSTQSETAFEVFNKMKENLVKPNTITWSIIINVAANRGDTTKALQLYEQAKQANIPESVYMLSSIIESLLLNHETTEAESMVLKASQAKQDQSYIRLWNSLFRYYAFQADSSSIHRVQGMMKTFGIKPDAMTYAALMTALVVRGQTQDAAKIVRTLHFSQQLNSNEFHYSILIHGFVQEGKWHMAAVIYREMLARFPRASPSAKLAMLHMQLLREGGRKTDDSGNFMSEQSLEQLTDLLIQDSRVDSASILPNPGFRRQPARNGLEAMYLGSLIAFLQRKDTHLGSKRLLRTASALASSIQASPSIRIGTHTLRMNAGIASERWAEVDEIWQEILAAGMKAFGALEDTAKSPSTIAEMSSNADYKTSPHGHNIEIIAAEEETFRSMLPPSMTRKEGSRVLPAHRFALSWPLSLYLQALDEQNRHHDTVLLVNDLQNRGFQLSGRNWNRYIQVLSKSADFGHRLLAFKMFQEHLLPQAPPWNIIRRGKWLEPRHAEPHGKSDSKPKNRSQLEKSNPSLALPSYFTMIHLATALSKSHKSTEFGDVSELQALQEIASATVDLVRKVPYLADRIQGVLMRGRSVIGDHPARARAADQMEDFSGVKGSKSLLDKLPVPTLIDLEKVLAPKTHRYDGYHAQTYNSSSSTILGSLQDRYAQHVHREETKTGPINRDPQYLTDLKRFENNSEARKRIRAEEMLKLQPLLDVAQQFMGDIPTGHQMLASQGRLETSKEVQARQFLQTVQRLDVLEQIRQDLRGPSVSNDAHRGEAVIGSLPPSYGLTDQTGDRKSLVVKLIDNPGDAVVQDSLDHRVDSNSYFSDSEIHAHSTGARASAQSSNRPPKSEQSQRSSTNMARNTWASKNVSSGNDTSALRRIIRPLYKSTNTVPSERVVYKRRGAWSFNKALRHQRLQAKQQQARLERTMLKGHKKKKAENRRVSTMNIEKTRKPARKQFGN